MPTRRSLLAASALAFALTLTGPVLAQEPMKVVATFSILGDMVSRVGGDRVAVVTLVGPDGDAHVYQPSPSDAQAVANADLIVANGLGFEGWMDRLVEASATKAAVVTATAGITPRSMEEEDHDHEEGEHAHEEGEHEEEEHAHEEGGHHHGHDHGGIDPHAWQSVPNAEIYVANIAKGLGAADPAGAQTYDANAHAYLAELAKLDADIRAGIAALPKSHRTIVTSHDAFGYFADAYGLAFIAPQGMSTEAEASAQDVARLITQIRDHGIAAVFVENISDPRLLEQIAAETNAKIGGTLYSDALSGPDGPAATYLDMMRHNLAQLTAALGS